MKIALISDIHSNLPALEAVLKDVRAQRVTDIWCLGDLLGYGAFPEESIGLLRNAGIKSIIGNYDLNVLNFPQKKKRWKRKKDPVKYFSFEWTYKKLSRLTKDYLKTLPKSRTIQIQGFRIKLVHGSPRSINEPLQNNTPEDRFAELAKIAKADVILCGHTHIFFSKHINGAWFINPGSVGRSFDLDPRASYAVISFLNGQVKVTNRRVQYDLKKSIGQMKKFKFPDELCRSIESAKSLDQVLEEKNKLLKEGLLSKSLALTESCCEDKTHATQVSKLSLILFDALRPLHRLDDKNRMLLEIAAILHDIGWIKGGKAHHKTSRDLILKDNALPLQPAERKIVAYTARYHRRSLPKRSHRDFFLLDSSDRKIISILASFLRIADGLDRQHQNNVEKIDVNIFNDRIVLKTVSRNPSLLEKQEAMNKGDLFKRVFKKDLLIQ